MSNLKNETDIIKGVIPTYDYEDKIYREE